MNEKRFAGYTLKEWGIDTTVNAHVNMAALADRYDDEQLNEFMFYDDMYSDGALRMFVEDGTVEHTIREASRIANHLRELNDGLFVTGGADQLIGDVIHGLRVLREQNECFIARLRRLASLRSEHDKFRLDALATSIAPIQAALDKTIDDAFGLAGLKK